MNPALIGGIVGGLGGLVGMLGNRPTFSMGAAGALETGAAETSLSSLNAAKNYAAPYDYSASMGGYNDLASMYQSMMATGGMPSAEDQARSASYASSIFSQQRTGLQQEFLRQMQAANQQAALSGRSQNDPILRAKLGQEQQRQQALLDAGQTGFAAQYAEQLPMKRLQFAEGRTNALTSMDQLGAGARQQGFINYAGLAGLGSQINQSQWGQRFHEASARFQSDAGQRNAADVFGGLLSGGLYGAGLGMRLGADQGAQTKKRV